MINRRTDKQIDITHGVIVIDNSNSKDYMFQSNSNSNR